MNRLIVAGGTALLLAIAVAACGGGGGGTSPSVSFGGNGPAPVAPTNPIPAATATGGLATLSLTIPRAASGSSIRRSTYISSATQSVAVFAYPAAATPPPTATTLVNVGAGAAGCTTATTTAGVTCTITVPAQYGSMTFIVKTYDGALGGGNLLSQATITQTIAPNQTAIPVTLSGVVAATQLSLPAYAFAAGGGSFAVTVNALDANGAVIVGSGTYSTPIALAASDPTVTFSPAVVTGPGQPVTLTYTAATSSSFRLIARANGVPESAQAGVAISISQPVASSLTAYIYDANRGFVFAMDAGSSGLPGYYSRYTFPLNYGVQLATNGTFLAYFAPYSSPIRLYGLHTGTLTSLPSPFPYPPQAITFDNSTGSPTSGDLAVLTPYAGPTSSPNVVFVAPTSSGTPVPVRTVSSSLLATVSSIGIDGSGNLYALIPYGTPEVLVYPPTSSTPATVLIPLASGEYINNRGLAVAPDGTFAVDVFNTSTNAYVNTIRVFGPSGAWALQRTIGGGPIAASFGGAISFAPDDSLYFASGSGIAVYAPNANGTPPPTRGFLTTLENVSSIDAMVLGAPLAATTPAATSLTGDMLGLAPNRTWNYNVIPASGPRATLTLYDDPSPVDGATGLVAFVLPTAAPDALPANGGTLAAALGITSASDGYHAQSYGSVSNDSFGLIPGAPLLVPPTLVSGTNFITYPGVTAEVRRIDVNQPGSSACPTAGAASAVVYYTLGEITEQANYVPGCGITRFISDAGTVFVLQSIGSHPELGQQSVTRRVLHATYGDTLRSIWQRLLVRH